MKLLLVDDEVIIRTGLSTVIKWEENGFELLEPAASAEEALLRIPIELPDIIITDIRMTGKTGLELAREVKRDFPEIEIIILSGYDDFKYAQQAIRDGVSDYLLKTTRPADIMSAVLQTKERKMSKQAHRIESEEHQTAFRLKLLERILKGEQTVTKQDEEAVLRHYPELQTRKESDPLMLWMIKLEDSALAPIVKENGKYAAAGASLRRSRFFVTVDWKDGWLILFRSALPGALELTKAALERIEATLEQPLFIAAGAPASNISELGESLRTAELAAEFRWLHARAGMVEYESVKGRKGMRTVCSREEEEKLIAVLRSGDDHMLRSWIEDMLNLIQADDEATPSSIKSFIHSFLVSGFRWQERAAASVGRVEQALPELEQLDMKRLTERPDEAVYHILSAIIRRYKRLNGSRSEAVEQTIAYIMEHLDSNLSLTQVAANVHMNPNYLSKLFKQETGKNYIEYVTEARMEWASRLLRETPAKVSEIAKRVGYEDIKHFNQLFKRHTGTTPSQYRPR